MKIVKPSIVRPRLEGGVDWSSERVVLVRKGPRELWWHRSHSYWAGTVGGTEHIPGSLVLVEMRPRACPSTNTLAEGGRLSRALLAKHSAKINDFFGWPKTSAHVDTKSTLVLHPRSHS